MSCYFPLHASYSELYVPVDDSVPMDYGHQMEVLYHTRAQECSGGHWGTLETSLLPPAALAEVVDGEDVPDTNDSAPEPRRVRSTSPTSMRGDSTVGPLSLPADLSSLSCLDANQSHADVSSLTSTSVHLDLLSETRQSLHPRWRRCFDRLTAMARGHLTRRLMKTHRVRSIIQTIKDTLECALRLHGDPHICSGLVTPQDVELHQRLITQLTAACYELHDVFFNIPIAERMQLIAQLRTHETRPVVSNRSSMDRGARKISSATQKVLERRISKLAGQDHQVQTKRPTAVVRAQTIVVTGPSDTCHTAGAAAQPVSGKLASTVNKIPHPTLEDGCFLHFLCDVPHIIKCVRNHLLSHAYAKAGPDCINYKHYQQLYETEKKVQLKVVPKLTSSHVNLGKLEKNECAARNRALQ
ncbi:hypothetical protein V5799_033231 [Amblyomma americanum]|uniref:Uncharacterized protein n=1 Tax=Amblyomma americanum TaxID=6943 RepID=A0AAQ4DNX1_AMBAM